MAVVGALGVHDVGGEDAGGMDLTDHSHAYWERAVDATQELLLEVRGLMNVHQLRYWERATDATRRLLDVRGLMNVHQLRKGIESMEPKAYKEASYYERWVFSLTQHCLANGIFTQEELHARLASEKVEDIEQRFKTGDTVQVRAANSRSQWRKPHLRTPGYIFEKSGEIERYCGAYGNPELLAFGVEGPKLPLYRVRFKQKDIWSEYDGSPDDTLDMEVYQHWLMRPQTQEEHEHKTREQVEKNAIEREPPASAYSILFGAMKDLLISKGVYTEDELRKQIDLTDSADASAKGPKIVAEAWTNADFRAKLLEDTNEAVRSIGLDPGHSDLITVENTEDTHNVVVCTLCSCYPRGLLGLPPDWYKSLSYRSRAVREPRSVLKEFGLDLPSSVKVQVHDSNADMRYFVLPKRPEGTDGWSTEKLASIVTRDCMIGVANPSADTSVGE